MKNNTTYGSLLRKCKIQNYYLLFKKNSGQKLYLNKNNACFWIQQQLLQERSLNLMICERMDGYIQPNNMSSALPQD